MKSARVLAIGLVGVSLATMGLVDRFVDRPSTKSTSATNEAGTLDPLASSVDSGSSLWFCPSGESADGADTIITIVNPTGQAGQGSVTFLGNAGQRATAEVQIGGHDRIDVRAAESLVAPGVGAIVEVKVGGLAVEQKVVRGNQTYGAPCATSTSTGWYFADGDTTLGASSVLSVLNPFGEDAVLDISFVTDRGAARPNDLQGFLVPASSMRRIDIGTYVRRRAQVSTVVKARVGRVAVDQTTSPDGVRFSMVNGAPALGSSWYFPAGRTNGVLRERYVLFNPTAVDISAQIDVVVEGGEVEPFELDVPARSRVDLVPNEESRIARDTDFSVVVATDSPSLVVQRTLRASGIYRAGFATTLGSRRSATAWIVSDVVASATRDDTISILNPTDTPTAVSLTLNSGAPVGAALGAGASVGSSGAGAGSAADSSVAVVGVGADSSLAGISDDGNAPVALAGAENLLVRASSRVTVRLSDFAAVAAGSLVVRSSAAEIVVERTATAIKRRAKRGDRPAYALGDAASLIVTPDTLPDVSSGSGTGTGRIDDNGVPVDDTYGADSSIAGTGVADTTVADNTVAAARVLGAKQVTRFGEFFVVVQAPSTTASANVSLTTKPVSASVVTTIVVTSAATRPTTTIATTILVATTTATRSVSTPVVASASIPPTTSPATAATTSTNSSTSSAVAGSSTTRVGVGSVSAQTSVLPVASTIARPVQSTVITSNSTIAPVASSSSVTTEPATTTSAVPTATTTTEKPTPKQPQMSLGSVAKAGASTFSAIGIPVRPVP